MREKELQKISEKYEKLEAEKVELERLQIELCNRKEGVPRLKCPKNGLRNYCTVP